MRTILAAAVALACTGGAAAQTVYRCDGADGRPVFQQHPCAGAGRVVDARPTNSLPPDPAAAAILARERSGSVSEADALRRYGRPSVTNTDYVGDSVSRQHVWRYPDGSRRYVYTRDGVVTAISERPAAAPRQRVRCPSEQEIRNERVSASSILLSAAERAARERRIAEMERCAR